MHFKRKQIKFFLLIILSIFFTRCISPVEPEYNFTDNLVFVDALASNTSNGSFVKIHKSVLINDHFLNSFISDANVVFRNIESNETVTLNEQNLAYVPDGDFKVSPGETWELQIILPDGRTYQSFPETVLEPVSMSEVSVSYDKEIVYNESSEDFVPGHSISVSFNDPPTDDNYYYWAYKAYEKLNICLECPGGTIYRNGECQTQESPVIPFSAQYSYGCETDCWKIRFNENINIFSDKFSNGNTINSLPVADILLYSKENMLVEIQQFSLTASAYEYYKVLKDILDNNGGINAPPPAAFIGNMFNPNDSEEIVLGKFTAASMSTQSIFIDRTNIPEEIIGGDVFRRFEGCEVCGCGPGCIPVTVVACEESRFSTGIEPEGWID